MSQASLSTTIDTLTWRSINAVLANAVLKPCLGYFSRKLAKKYFFTKPSPAGPAVPLVWARSFSFPPAGSCGNAQSYLVIAYVVRA